MKKAILLISSFLLASSVYSQIVSIPDSAFKAQILADGRTDANGDGEVQVLEAEQTFVLNFSNAGIQDLTGIEAFINLVTLRLDGNNISNVDLSSNLKLESVYLNRNTNLSALDVTMLPQLFRLIVNYTNIADLDLSLNPDLRILDASYTDLSNLDLSAQDELLNLSIDRCKRFTYLDISNLTKLTRLSIGWLYIDTLVTSTHDSLTSVGMSVNNIDNIDALLSPKLKDLVCWGNELESLDLSNCPLIQSVLANNNPITQFYPGTPANLVLLDLSSCELEEINLKSCINLRTLRLHNNNLNSLELYATLNLIEKLKLGDNAFTKIDLSFVDSLKEFNCENNLDLIELNLRNGSPQKLTILEAMNTPKLFCIQVDDTAYSNSNWELQLDDTTLISEECGFYGLSNQKQRTQKLVFYPNPANQAIYFDQFFESIQIYSTDGKLHLTRQKCNSIKLEALAPGMYYIKAAGQNQYYSAPLVKR